VIRVQCHEYHRKLAFNVIYFQHSMREIVAGSLDPWAVSDHIVQQELFLGSFTGFLHFYNLPVVTCSDICSAAVVLLTCLRSFFV